MPLPARPTDAAQSSATEVEPQQPPAATSTEQQPPVEAYAPPPPQQQGESVAGTARPVVDCDVPLEGFQSRWQCDDDKLPLLHEEPPQQQREVVAVAWHQGRLVSGQQCTCGGDAQGGGGSGLGQGGKRG